MLDPQARYQQLGELIGTFPDLAAKPMSDETLRWCARLNALLQDASELVGQSELRSSLNQLRTSQMVQVRYAARDCVKATLFNAFAVAELSAPAGIRGAFIPAGNAHDGLMAIGKVIGEAREDVLLVDPYMDHNVLSDYAVLARERIAIRLLTDAGTVKPGFAPAVRAWKTQYTDRSLDARLAAARTLHDRLAIVDNSTVFLLTQSFNAFAARSPATIQRVDSETAALKLAAYRDLWALASPLPR